MIQILGKLPSHRIIAVSGGSDSMAIMDFCRKYHTVSCIFVDHNTHTSKLAKEFLLDFTNENSLKLDMPTLSGEKPSNESWEEYLRNERLKIFWSYEQDVIT